MTDRHFEPADSPTRGDQTPPTTASSKRPYRKPSIVEYGSVAKLTAAKTGVPTDGGMPMNSCL